MVKNEFYEITNCPICGNTHKYPIEVTIIEVIMNLTFFSRKMEKSVRKTFTQLFTCPNKQKTFQATITLTETPGEKIESVTVKGVVENEQ